MWRWNIPVILFFHIYPVTELTPTFTAAFFFQYSLYTILNSLPSLPIPFHMSVKSFYLLFQKLSCSLWNINTYLFTSLYFYITSLDTVFHFSFLFPPQSHIALPLSFVLSCILFCQAQPSRLPSVPTWPTVQPETSYIHSEMQHITPYK